MAGLKLSGKDPFDRDSVSFKDCFRDAIYETLFDVAVENLPHCNIVIVGPFTRELRDKNWLNKLNARLQCKVNVVYVFCEAKERKARLQARGNPRDEGKFEDYEKFNQYYGDERSPAFVHTFIDTSQLKSHY